jgi:hypothetical protein
VVEYAEFHGLEPDSPIVVVANSMRFVRKCTATREGGMAKRKAGFS